LDPIRLDVRRERRPLRNHRGRVLRRNRRVLSRRIRLVRRFQERAKKFPNQKLLALVSVRGPAKQRCGSTQRNGESARITNAGRVDCCAAPDFGTTLVYEHSGAFSETVTKSIFVQ